MSGDQSQTRLSKAAWLAGQQVVCSFFMSMWLAVSLQPSANCPGNFADL